MRTDSGIIDLIVINWKEIPGTEGIYKASSHGQIKSVTHTTVNSKGIVRTFPGKLLSQSKQTNGYLACSIQVGKISKRVSVHRLVAAAFLGESDLQVNHINGDKTDNRVDNLEYCTASQNIKHSFKIGLVSNKGDKHSQSVLSNQQAKEIYELAKANHKTSDIAKTYGVSTSLVSNIKHGRNYSSVTTAN